MPLLYFFYGHGRWSGVEIPAELEAVVAHATSLFVILPTSALGTWTYQRSGAVSWRAALPIAMFSVVAAVGATQLAPMVPAPLLKLGFGLLLVVSGARLLHGRRQPEGHSDRPHFMVGALSGLAIGVMSALLGVGGGIVAIPILVYLVGLRLDQVAATSMAIIMFTAAAGVIGYAATGVEVGMPPGSVGYVHVMAGVPILAGSLLAVSQGAKVNRRMGTRKLRILFGLLFLALGLQLVIGNASTLPGLF